MEVKDSRRPMILAPTPRERERWYAILLLAQGWTSSTTAQALERDPHTIGPLLQAQEGVGLRGGRARCLGLRADRGVPRPWRDAAGGVEGSGPRVTGDSRHRPGQLELEGGPSVSLGTIRDQPLCRSICLNYPRFHGGRLCTGWGMPSSTPRSGCSRRTKPNGRPSWRSTPPCGTRRDALAERYSLPTRPTSGLTRNCGGNGC